MILASHFLHKLTSGKKSNKLVLVYDGPEQLTTNPFTHQLYITLRNEFNLRLVRTKEFAQRSVTYNDGQTVLIISRLRNWHDLPGKSEAFFLRSRVYFYDQDPWEGYHDNASCKGIYESTFSKVKPRAFLVTSPWWASYIREKSGLPVESVRMGVLPEYCQSSKSFGEKKFPLGFQGSVHQHRMEFYDRLAKSGCKVEILPRKPFLKFLDTVQDVGIFIYSDQSAIKLDNKQQPLHGLWGKCLTVAARGCFVIRNYDLAYDGYGIDEIPTISAFETEDQIPGLVAKIRNRTVTENDELIAKSVAILKERNDWKTVGRVLTRTMSD